MSEVCVFSQKSIFLFICLFRRRGSKRGATRGWIHVCTCLPATICDSTRFFSSKFASQMALVPTVVGSLSFPLTPQKQYGNIMNIFLSRKVNLCFSLVKLHVFLQVQIGRLQARGLMIDRFNWCIYSWLNGRIYSTKMGHVRFPTCPIVVHNLIQQPGELQYFAVLFRFKRLRLS